MTDDHRWRDAPGPCVSVCKARSDGVCRGCGLKRAERQAFSRSLSRAVREPILQTGLRRLSSNGRFLRFVLRYAAKCERRGVKNPLRNIRF